MRVAVLPRETAAAVITKAVSRGGWAVAAVLLLLTIPSLLDIFWQRNLGGELLVPLLALVIMLCALAVTAWNPRWWMVLLYLAVGGTCIVVYQLSVLHADPKLLHDAVYLLNRPAVAILLVGTLSATTLMSLLWCVLGYAVGLVATVIVSAILHLPIVAGWGPTLVLALYVTAYLTLSVIQREQRRRVPDFAAIEERTRQIEAERDLVRLTAAVVHDTVLNDLSFIINAPDRLDDRARERLRTDVATLTSADWLREARSVTALDDADASIRNELTALISEMQWRGLTVHVSGSSIVITRSSPPVVDAVVNAVRACLENVLRHSGTTVAEVIVGYGDGASTIMVIDEGTGFDPDAVPSDRLGLKVSVRQRIEAVGGEVRLWSSAGNGTSVLIAYPAVDVADDGSTGDGQASDRGR